MSHEAGVVPVSARKRRANVRSDMSARAARLGTECSSSRCSTTHASSGASVSASHGSGVSTYCACPPSRCGGTTMRRAMVAAAEAPSSRRTRYRLASIPEAVPALVSTRSSST